MAKEAAALIAFNRGRLGRLGLARLDLKRAALSAEVQTNWMPRALGAMSLRPGFGYTGASRENRYSVTVPFMFSTTDLARIELTSMFARVWVDDALVSRAAVSATVTNGTFDADLTGWTDADEAGAGSSWATGGYMLLEGTKYNAAIRRQEVTVAGGDYGVQHALNIVINRGPVTLKVGSTTGGDDYINETELATGYHSLAFTPTGNFHVELSSRVIYGAKVDSVQVAAAGAMELATIWPEAALDSVRYWQSADVIFIACDGYRPQRIERRGTRSWSVVDYRPINGPLRNENVSTIRLTPSALTGEITLTASRAYFRSGHVGAVFRMKSLGQRVEASVNGADQWTDPVKTTGVGAQRAIIVTASGGSMTLRVQRSIGAPGAWSDWHTYASDTTINDGLDNQEVYHRFGCKTGEYTSGTADIALEVQQGSVDGYVEITAYSSPTSVTAIVLKDLGGDDAIEGWSEGAWSPLRGQPTAVAIYEGRLWWAGRDKIYGSVSDAYDDFEEATEGDSGPINRSFATSGSVDVCNWLMPAQRLIAGLQGAEVSVRSSSQDEPLTPTNFNIKEASTQGSAAVAAVKIDSTVVFVQRGGNRVYGLDFSLEKNDYEPTDFTAAVPEIGEPGIVRIAVQRQPDTRIHCVRSDGTVAVLLFDKTENVMCWVDVESTAADGEIEDVCILPGTPEDRIYYTIKRTIDGATVRYHEKWALESECRGGTLNKQADAFLAIDQASSATVTGLDIFEGEDVVLWAGGKDLGAYTVAGGSITASEAVTTAIVGLYYRARFKNAKMALGAALGAPLTQPRIVHQLGLILADTHYQGLHFGKDFDNLDPLPVIVDEVETAADTVWESFDDESVPFDGAWDTDSRLCLEARAPRPCTVLAAIAHVLLNEKGL